MRHMPLSVNQHTTSVVQHAINFLVMLFMLFGCQQSNRVERTYTSAPDAALPAASKTEQLLTPVPEANKEFDSIIGCVPVKPQTPQRVNLNGSLVVYDSSRQPANDAFLMGLSSGSFNQLTQMEQIIISLRISPNGKWIAYLAVNKKNYKDMKLVVKNIAANSTIEIAWKPEWDLSGLERWLNDQELLIALESSDYPPPLIAFNPFSKDSSVLPSTFPNQEVLDPGSGVSFAEYAPSLDDVVYPALEHDVDGFSLFNRTANRQIAFFPSQTLVEAGSPAWSHDGQKFVFVSKMVNSGSYVNLGMLDGSVRRIVDLSREMSSFRVESFAWSPNDKFVAVVVFNVDQQVGKLLLLDIESQKVVDPCVEVNYDHWTGGGPVSDFPVWAPDSRSLIVEKQSGEGKNKVILINLPQMSAGILAQDQRVLGWISAVP